MACIDPYSLHFSQLPIPHLRVYNRHNLSEVINMLYSAYCFAENGSRVPFLFCHRRLKIARPASLKGPGTREPCLQCLSRPYNEILSPSHRDGTCTKVQDSLASEKGLMADSINPQSPPTPSITSFYRFSFTDYNIQDINGLHVEVK